MIQVLKVITFLTPPSLNGIFVTGQHALKIRYTYNGLCRKKVLNISAKSDFIYFV